MEGKKEYLLSFAIAETLLAHPIEIGVPKVYMQEILKKGILSMNYINTKHIDKNFKWHSVYFYHTIVQMCM
ncbi:hypothetical protein HWV54_03015 [Bartonella alsatica]|uniref:Uncharacterized protein n=2 Tax=Bartonella alsatica TaxID=52764 RepID=J0PP99_9HYPH|nr:hypothetical protein [Bartonella alsatica]EJF74301.1 hypothetical protein MEC_01311 [Bartonella alsatica IBS 382]QLC51884.1 hypothetical protein HWV54_03015 [Bartonella alsatica]